MARQRVDPKQSKLKKQERNQRYRENLVAKERNKAHDRIYQQRKREQARLQKHEDPLARLADVETQQRYLQVEGDTMIDRPMAAGFTEEDEERIDISGIIEEDGQVLDNFDDGTWGEGFNDEEWRGGFDYDNDNYDVNNDGNQYTMTFS